MIRKIGEAIFWGGALFTCTTILGALYAGDKVRRAIVSDETWEAWLPKGERS